MKSAVSIRAPLASSVSYIEIVADLPWNKLSQDNLDLDQAQQILDRDHYDLEK